MFTNPRILVYYRKDRPLYILPDISKQYGFGTVIEYLKGDALVTSLPIRTKLEPVLFLSKTLLLVERRY